MTFLNKALWVLAGVVILYLAIVDWRLNAAKSALEVAKDQAFAAKAASEGWVQAKEASWKAISDGLNRENLDLGMEIERLRRSDPSVQPISHAKATVTIADTAKGVSEGSVLTPAYCPEAVSDEYGRFRFTIPKSDAETPFLTRKQQFVFDVVVLKRLNGSAEFAKAELREYKPGAEPSPATLIPASGVDAKLNMELASEAPPPVKMLHPRLVFAFDHRAALGGGIEVLNFKDRANLGLLGFYDRKANKADLAIFGGYRLKFPALNTNLSVGPTYYPLSKKFGAGITLELTR